MSMGKWAFSHSIGGNLTWYCFQGGQFSSIYKSFNCTNSDPAIPLIGIYSSEIAPRVPKIYIHCCEAYYTKNWKLPKFPSVGGYGKINFTLCAMEFLRQLERMKQNSMYWPGMISIMSQQEKRKQVIKHYVQHNNPIFVKQLLIRVINI